MNNYVKEAEHNLQRNSGSIFLEYFKVTVVALQNRHGISKVIFSLL